MFIVGAGCALGYWLNKDGKQSRESEKPSKAPAKMMPSGPNVYQSDRVKEVDAQLKKLADAKYQAKMEQLYPGITGKTGIVPNEVSTDALLNSSDGLGDGGDGDDYVSITDAYPGQYSDESPREVLSSMTPYNSVSSKDVAKNAALLQQGQVQENFQDVNDDYAIDPYSGAPVVAPSADAVAGSTMFRRPSYLNPFHEPRFSNDGAEVSALTGLPLDKTHANMQPFYSGALKHNVADQNGQVLLEKYTGTASSSDYGTYRPHKKEIRSLFAPVPDNPIKSSFDQVPNRYESANTVVGQSHEYMNTFASFRDLPIETQAVRVDPTHLVDANRSVLNPYVAYTTAPIPGQKGSTRAMMSRLADNALDLSGSIQRYQNETHGDANVMSAVAKPIVLPTPFVRDGLPSTDVLSNDSGPSNFSIQLAPERNTDQMTLAVAEGMRETSRSSNRVPTIDSGFPELGYGGGTTKTNIGGGVGAVPSSYVMRSSSNPTETSYLVAPSRGALGGRLNNVTKTDVGATMRDVRAESGTGPSNPSGLKLNDGVWKSRYVVDATSKDMNAVNTYVGQSFLKMDGAYSKTKFDAWTTSKEMTDNDVFHELSMETNLKSAVPKSISYDSLFVGGTTSKGGDEHVWMGAPTSEVKRAMNEPDHPLYTSKDGYAELETGYVGQAEVRVKRPLDVHFDLTNQLPRVEAGGHVNGKSAGRFGTDGKRFQRGQAPDNSMPTNGRVNTGVNHSYADRAKSNAYVADDDTQSVVSEDLNRRTVPSRYVRSNRDITGVPTKTKNTEATNNRIGEQVAQVVNDLRPKHV